MFDKATLFSFLLPCFIIIFNYFIFIVIYCLVYLNWINFNVLQISLLFCNLIVILFFHECWWRWMIQYPKLVDISTNKRKMKQSNTTFLIDYLFWSSYWLVWWIMIKIINRRVSDWINLLLLLSRNKNWFARIRLLNIKRWNLILILLTANSIFITSSSENAVELLDPLNVLRWSS